MIQVLDKYGNTSTDDGRVVIIDKFGNIKKSGQGILLPRMTTAQVNAIVSPVQGLTVFNTDLNTLCFYTTSWQKVTSTTM